MITIRSCSGGGIREGAADGDTGGRCGEDSDS
jgi:hypothetical protein